MLADLSQSELQTAIEAIGSPVFVVDILTDGSFRYAAANSADLKMTGFRADQLIGLTPEQAFGAAMAAQILSDYRRCIATRKVTESEQRLDFAGQEPRWWHRVLTPMFDKHQRMVRILGTLSDITGRKRAEERLRRLETLVQSGGEDQNVDHEAQLLDLARRDLLVQVLERDPGRALALQPVALAAHGGDLARLALVGDDQHGVARLRDAGEAEDLDRIRRPRARDLLAAVVEHRAHAPGVRADHHRVAFPERARLDEGGGHRTAPAVEPALHDDPARGPARDSRAARGSRPAARSSRGAAAMPSPRLAEVWMKMVWPPQSSGTRPWLASSRLTRSGSAPGLSILFTATMIGTLAALAWLIASTVCGITPSSAATTRMTMSVAWAPRARMAVNASWPGVSRKVTLPWLVSTW